MPESGVCKSGVVDRGLATHKVGDMTCLCDIVYDTNYKVFFMKRDDGSVDVVYGDYDCGY